MIEELLLFICYIVCNISFYFGNTYILEYLFENSESLERYIIINMQNVFNYCCKRGFITIVKYVIGRGEKFNDKINIYYDFYSYYKFHLILKNDTVMKYLIHLGKHNYGKITRTVVLFDGIIVFKNIIKDIHILSNTQQYIYNNILVTDYKSGHDIISSKYLDYSFYF